MRKSKRCLKPWCPACGGSLAMAMRWARSVEPSGVVLIDLDDAGGVKTVKDEPTVDVRCGFCCGTVQVGRDVPLAAA